MPVVTVADIQASVGTEVGVSSWLTIDQPRIDAFADATEDRQFIHVDPAAAAQTPLAEPSRTVSSPVAAAAWPPTLC